MEIRPIAAIIAVIALVTIAAGVAVVMNPESTAQAASFQASPTAGPTFVDLTNAPFDPYGAVAQPLPPGQPRVVFNGSAQEGVWFVLNGTTYDVVWKLNNTGRQTINVQPYAIINGVMITGPTISLRGGEVQEVRVNTGLTATQLPSTIDVNVKEFRGNSRNYWISYDDDVTVNKVIKQ